MAGRLLSLAGWTFLPDFATSNLQSFYYGLTIRAGDPRPQPGTELYLKHRQRIYIGVILAYLAYTIYEADWDIQRAGDFYRDLGVPHDVGDKALQTRFRKLTLLHHPDKIGGDRSSVSEEFYMQLKLARETLAEPAKRFAYDRFGPASLQWKNCVTGQEYMLHGLRASSFPFYVGVAVVIAVMDWMDLLGFGGLWRYWALAIMFALELHLVTRPYFSFATQLPTLINPLLERLPLSVSALLGLPALRTRYLPFQAIEFLHRGMATVFIALARLGPLLFSRSFLATQFGTSSTSARAAPATTGDAATRRPAEYIPDSDEAIRHTLAHLEQVVAINSAESKRLLMLEAAPFAITAGGSSSRSTVTAARGEGEGEGEDKGGEDLLRQKVKRWLITNTVRSDPGVQQAVRTITGRLRAGGSQHVHQNDRSDNTAIDSSSGSSATAQASASAST